MKYRRNPPDIWIGQLLHVGGLAVLLPLVWIGWNIMERPFTLAFWLSIGIPIIHQVYVWLAWRLELRSGATSKVISFKGYLSLFFLFFVGRFIALVTLAWLDRGSLGLQLIPQIILTATTALVGIYSMYSVIRYFGFKRAAGADHFDPGYRKIPLVKEGIFRYTNNGMYVYAFLLHWAIAFVFNSRAALLATVFCHAYVWVHFYATEKPDMEFLYGGQD